MVDLGLFVSQIPGELQRVREGASSVAWLDSPLVGALVGGFLAMVASSLAAFYASRFALKHERRRYLVFQAITPLQARIEEVRFRIAQVLSYGEISPKDFDFDLQDYFGASVILKDFRHLGEESRELLDGVTANSHPAELFETLVRNLSRTFSHSGRPGALTEGDAVELKRVLDELAELRRCLSVLGEAILRAKLRDKKDVGRCLENLRSKIVGDIVERGESR